MPLPQPTYVELLTNLRLTISLDLARLDRLVALLPQYETLEGVTSGLAALSLQVRTTLTTVSDLIGLLQIDAA